MTIRSHYDKSNRIILLIHISANIVIDDSIVRNFKNMSINLVSPGSSLVKTDKSKFKCHIIIGTYECISFLIKSIIPTSLALCFGSVARLTVPLIKRLIRMHLFVLLCSMPKSPRFWLAKSTSTLTFNSYWSLELR